MAGTASAAEPVQVRSLQRSGWNLYATRFMYPPTFDVEPFAGGASYRVTIQSRDGKWQCTVGSAEPHLDLNGQWRKLPPTLDCQAWIEALDSNEQVIARGEMFGLLDLGEYLRQHPELQ